MIQKPLNAKRIFALLFIVLIITKLQVFGAIKLESQFFGQSILINWPLILTVFAIAAGAIFIRRGSNDCWFIALNFVVLILVAIVLEWYQPGLGIGIFVLMLSTAVAEELIVRYAFFELLWPRFKPAMIILLSALLFMGIHTNIYTQFESSVMVFVFGLVLGAIYARFKQKDQTIKGIALVSWLHLGALLLSIHS